ncbi:hypothetical protein FOZ63_023066 [Perkinsus olseni]|uniref:Uncharacterized protein n=1 Tax=Perkinsus olseni TaxID=32597 RepID=A0A7J6RSF4_PEROL|nr:hypothetical protein FOZ60_013673 [Perkinsus olseni]KAF4723325.1 hypothetical protein FOZ62_002997 [Perkinsus olseni]KAF4723653.1 hypothetical protein FOZ63_023066 [Perkinsus olseni]
MMNFVSTWLIPAQLLVISTAQEVGKFVHRSGFYDITWNVNEERQAMIEFTSIGPPLPGSPEGTSSFNLVNRHGFYSLSKVGANTYAVGSAASLHKLIAHQLRQADAARAHEPLAGIQPEDLTTWTYTSGDGFTTGFRGETIEFMRVAESVTPGVFEYAESVAPYFKLTYVILDESIVSIQASCNRRRTSQMPFRLSRRGKGVQYVRYELESAGRGTLDQLLYMVNKVCPHRYLVHDDLSHLVVATSNTIYVTLGGARVALTRIK